MEKIKELLKDKNKLLMLVPLLLGILFVVVFFGKQNTEEAVIDKENQSLLEPKSEGEKKLKTKLDAYRKEKEEAERKKRELEESKVAGSDFYLDMQSSDEEYDKKMKERIAKMQRDPLDKVSYEYRGSGGSSFSSKMRKQLEDIEDQETFDQIVSNAQKDERIRKELEKHKQFRDEMRRKYLAESSDEQEDYICLL